MKTLITAAVLTAAVLTSPAMAFGLSSQSIIPNLTFPEPVSEPVTQDKTKPGN